MQKGEISMLIQYKDGRQDGRRISWYENGLKRFEGTYKDGLLDGLATRWYDNGQKGSENTFKAGKLWTAVAWRCNGEQCPDTNIIGGNGVIVRYDESSQNGSEWQRETYKEGKMVKQISASERARMLLKKDRR